METEHRIVEKNIYETGKHEYASKATANTALGFGIGGTVLAAAALCGRGRGLFGGGSGIPENVNINNNTVSPTSPSSFSVFEKECDDVIELTKEIYGSKISTLNQTHEAREIDINEKFQI